jgi:hypothetical protein
MAPEESGELWREHGPHMPGVWRGRDRESHPKLGVE